MSYLQDKNFGKNNLTLSQEKEGRGMNFHIKKIRVDLKILIGIFFFRMIFSFNEKLL